MTPAASQKRMPSMRAEGARSRPQASGLGPRAGEENRPQRGNGFSHKLAPGALAAGLLVFAARADPGWLQRHLYQPAQLIPSGDSSAFGHGLKWEESLPGILARALHVQVIDVAVSGYSTRQAALRLAEAAPRFHQVVASVMSFLPVQLGRNLERRSSLRLFELFPLVGASQLEES